MEKPIFFKPKKIKKIQNSGQFLMEINLKPYLQALEHR